ncbi:phosphonate ABC transporter ATP-binding protein [Piscinibacter sakaiensis]|uniref:phosphonate ABC transporter ATP-binding protein n=1 Tax=Piscinibacter sakaiensis TaxID=1547922 RepID=UPI003AAA5116
MNAAGSAVGVSGVFAAAAPLSPTPVLRGVDLHLQSGEQVAVIGASGAGKSTLLNVLACAVRPLEGTVSLFGEDPWSIGARSRQRLRSRLCLAPQVPPLPPRQRVVTAVLAGALPEMSLLQSMRNLWSPLDPQRAHAALASLDVGDKLWERVDRLSGGERQRVGLARLLLAEAELWLVDEPLSALDPARAEQAIRRIVTAAREAGSTLVCSLHQVDVARQCFARIVALRDGEVAFDGPVEQLDDAMVRDLYGQEALTGPAEQPFADLAIKPLVSPVVCR